MWLRLVGHALWEREVAGSKTAVLTTASMLPLAQPASTRVQHACIHARALHDMRSSSRFAHARMSGTEG